MNRFNNMIEKLLVPVARKLNEQRHVGAIRDAFILTFPLTLSASMVILLNNLVFSTEGMIAKLLFLPKLFPNINDVQQFLSPVANGTLNLMSIFIAYLIAHALASHFRADALLAGLTSIACFIILYPQPFFNEDIGSQVMVTTYLGAQGLFVAMLVGCLVGEFLPKLFASKRLIIKMPDMVPPAVSRTFSALLPIMIVIMFCSVISAVLTLMVPGGINELIYNGLQTPLRKMGANIFGVMLIVLFEHVLWIMGIHGPNTLAPIKSAIFSEPNLTNMAHINDGGALSDIPYYETLSVIYGPFGQMGGAGMTLGLVIAILIVSKRKDHQNIAKLSFAPSIFNINEPIIFGLPIVLNPIFMIPFVLIPMVTTFIGYLTVVVFKLIPPPVFEIPWTTPGPINAFLATGGNLLALGVSIFCLIISVLVYLPFVIASNKVQQS